MPSIYDAVSNELDRLQGGGSIDRKYTIYLLKVLHPYAPKTPAQSAQPTTTIPYPAPENFIEPPTDTSSERIPTRKEGTPVRFAARNWGAYSPCKRCGSGNVPDGDMIVRIYGTGWWHDNCYRKVNPQFYEGL